MSHKNGSVQNVQKLKNLDSQAQNIIREAIEARLMSYSPYSNFKVGACLLCEDGTTYRGCNVENSAFTVGVCAERCAYVKAISEGKLKYKAIAVAAYQEKAFTTPCGACRQFISEFGNIPIYLVKPDEDNVFVTSVEELLPHSFQTSLDNLFK